MSPGCSHHQKPDTAVTVAAVQQPHCSLYCYCCKSKHMKLRRYTTATINATCSLLPDLTLILSNITLRENIFTNWFSSLHIAWTFYHQTHQLTVRITIKISVSSFSIIFNWRLQFYFNKTIIYNFTRHFFNWISVLRNCPVLQWSTAFCKI